MRGDYVPQTIGEIVDHLGSMMLTSPLCRDLTGYFPEKNIETTFVALNDGLSRMRSKLGEEHYETLISMAAKMRAHFEADPENKTDDTLTGRRMIVEMQELLKRVARRRA